MGSAVGNETEQPFTALPDDAHDDIRALYDYWLSISKDGKLPGRDDFDPIDVPKLLPSLWLLEVHRDPLRFWRRTVGSKIEEFAGRKLTGGWVGDQLNGPRATGVSDPMTDVVETKQPSWRRGRSLIRFDKDFAELERLYLPMGSDGETVDMILAITVFEMLSFPDRSNMGQMPGALDANLLLG